MYLLYKQDKGINATSILLYFVLHKNKTLKNSYISSFLHTFMNILIKFVLLNIYNLTLA